MCFSQLVHDIKKVGDHRFKGQSVHAYLVSPLLPADQRERPDIFLRRRVPRFWPLLPTAGRMCSMTHCHTLKGRVSDHGHRICWMKRCISEKEIDKNLYLHKGPTYQGRVVYNTPSYNVKYSGGHLRVSALVKCYHVLWILTKLKPRTLNRNKSN